MVLAASEEEQQEAAPGSSRQAQQSATGRAWLRGALGQGTQFDARRVRTYETPFR